MDNILVSIHSLYEKYREEPKTLKKLQTYVINELPILMEQYHKQELNKIKIEKESNNYIQNFLNCSKNNIFISTKQICLYAMMVSISHL